MFLKGLDPDRKNRTIARHAFPAHGLKNSRATHFAKKKRKKIRKSRDFRGISKISETNYHRPDIYLEKNQRDFQTVIFSGKKFFTENPVSIFAKKLDKKFVFLKKKGIVQKRKMSQIFRREVRGNQTEITPENFF